MFESIVRNVVFYDLEKPGYLASRAEFCGTPGHSSLKPIKLGLSSEDRDEWGPYVCRNRREAYLTKQFRFSTVHLGGVDSEEDDLQPAIGWYSRRSSSL
jgi:hypothetical protein